MNRINATAQDRGREVSYSVLKERREEKWAGGSAPVRLRHRHSTVQRDRNPIYFIGFNKFNGRGKSRGTSRYACCYEMISMSSSRTFGQTRLTDSQHS